VKTHKKWTSIFKYLDMESTSETSQSSVESTARTRFTRGISLKACVAKAAGWTLEKYKDVTLPEIKECKTT
jgi:hypothetical protein